MRNKLFLYKKAFFLMLFLLCSHFYLFAQEKLLSTFENYYDFLSLDGHVKRPSLNFRSLSDSKWEFNDTTADLWNIRQLKPCQKSVRIYGPELYTSYNGASPYGQNDGLLWQGKGFNAYLSAGIRYEKNGFEITFKPEIAYSSNEPFEYLPPSSYYNDPIYNNKASKYGYFGIPSVDAPQRFGENPFLSFGLGDSEIRYSYKAFTVGFGTQYFWLGPAKINPILHSNNAPSYPKVDIGIRRLPLKLFGWDAGEIEARLWVGLLSESNYFDNNSDNNHNLLSGLAVAYSPSFLKGLTLSANRTFICFGKAKYLTSIPELFLIRLRSTGDSDDWDQRASIGFSYSFPKSGAEIYAEYGINDYAPSLEGYVRYPFHSRAYTAGLRKSVSLSLFSIPMRGELLFEVSNFEMSQDFQFQWPSSFYIHHLIKQGYTNKGQWLGAGNGTGGNSQYLGFKIYHPKGFVNMFVHRQNPDNDYIYQYSVGTEILEDTEYYIKNFKTNLAFGTNFNYFIRPNIQLCGGLSYILELNPLYNAISWSETSKQHSLRLEAGAAYHFR